MGELMGTLFRMRETDFSLTPALTPALQQSFVANHLMPQKKKKKSEQTFQLYRRIFLLAAEQDLTSTDSMYHPFCLFLASSTEQDIFLVLSIECFTITTAILLSLLSLS